MKNIFLSFLLISTNAFANLGRPEQVHISHKSPYALPKKVKMAVIEALDDLCNYHQNSHHWHGSAVLINNTTYTYKVIMSGEDAQIPHRYEHASMIVDYDAALDKAVVKNLDCR